MSLLRRALGVDDLAVGCRRVISHGSFPVAPWCLRETSLELDLLAQTESLFASSNGNIGWRANLDEGEPHAMPGSYLAGVHELRPLPYAEAGYGFPESGQSVINVHNAKLVRLVVNDQPFDVRDGELLSHERVLDFKGGTLDRAAVWRSPSGRQVKVRSRRLVSLVQRSVAAIAFEVTAIDSPVRVVLQSELVANEAVPERAGDPRAAAALQSPLVAEEHRHGERSATLVHRTAASGIEVAASMDHVVEGPAPVAIAAESDDDLGRVTVIATLAPQQRLRLVKIVAHGWSRTRSRSGVRDHVEAAVAAAMATGFDGLVAEQRAFLDAFWQRADVEIHGDPEIQQAVRFALFHLLQAGARIESQPIAAKGLTGPGYDGHAFWDTEAFVLPVLSYVHPAAAAQALRWRWQTLPAARSRARQLNLAGASFPWRTINGEECSGYWPAGTAAFHVNADIAAAVVRYVAVTGDDAFEAGVGVELLVETARLWRSLGHHDTAGRFRIDGVTGPDEYSAVCDNNLYTNLMAKANLEAAAALVARRPDRALALGVDDEELASWRDAAKAMTVPYDEDLGVHLQAEGFTSHERWDFEHTTPAQYPLFLHFPYFDLYRKQVVKQADLVLAMALCPDAFDPEHKERNFAYYEALTVRDSSLSAATQSVLAAEVGHLDLALDYLAEAALMDLDDLERNTADGLHLGALAGVWSTLVNGLVGLRDQGPVLRFTPRLPASIRRLVAHLTVAGGVLEVEVTAATTTYVRHDGDPLTVLHAGEPCTVAAGTPVRCPTPRPPDPGPFPSQPPGRAPRRRTRPGHLAATAGEPSVG